MEAQGHDGNAMVSGCCLGFRSSDRGKVAAEWGLSLENIFGTQVPAYILHGYEGSRWTAYRIGYLYIVLADGQVSNFPRVDCNVNGYTMNKEWRHLLQQGKPKGCEAACT